MKIDGEMFIEAICNRLRDEDVRLYDSEIVKKIRALNSYEVLKIATFGDVNEWRNDRINKAASQKGER